MKVAVIGAGPAGITTAYELVKHGIEVEVFEAGSSSGGMAKTIDLWNQRVDLGPHRFFSKDKRINEIWLEVIGGDYQIVSRLTRILYNKKFYNYPLSPMDALKNMGLGQSMACIFSYIKENFIPTKQDGSFETFVKGRFGKRLYDIFFKPYSEKLWGIPCTELDSDFASQRIKKLSLFEAVYNALIKNKAKKHRTLIEQFAYPNQGTGSVYEGMARCIESHGGRIYYNTPIDKVIVEKQKANAVILTNGKTYSGYDYIVSSMPISLLVSRLADVPRNVLDAASTLRFRNTILVYLNVDSINLFPDQWIYVQSPEFKVGRITNFRNWVPQLYGKEKSTIIVMEYWCNDEDPIWKDPAEKLISLAKEEFRAMNFPEAKVINGHVERIPRCYPVYSKGYKNTVKVVQDYLKTIDGLSVIGRYGAFKYNNQDHSILMGLLAAANIAKGQKNDLWAINTDYEDYQESFVITKTGLVKE